MFITIHCYGYEHEIKVPFNTTHVFQRRAYAKTLVVRKPFLFNRVYGKLLLS